MLLDNKTKTDDNEHYKVFDFIKANTENGSLDLVTGYFTINALALMKDHINSVEKFRLILGNLMQEESQINKVIDLLNGDTGISSTLSLSTSAQKAVAFLQQDKVSVKNIQKNFCHAKTYLYTDKTKTKNYFIVGSSNLTDAGLGIKDSSNIELNIAKHDYEDEFKNLKKWFQEQWEKVASEIIELPNKNQIEVKQYIIELIKKLYKEYTPHDLYFKVLYEMFKDDIMELSGDAEFKREIAHLEETVIYKSLFPYQQKGAISLIKMLQKYNGAILADAVGLGKTWTALAVMKYFELKGYTVLLLCPKKLANNWQQYKIGQQSRFEKDEIDFYIRYHTDLQEGRFDCYNDKTLRYFKTRPKLLIVIDESHNLRNDKSSRYKFLINEILLPENKSRDVKVMHLSATPINNKLMDIRNQFKLMTKGLDDGFKQTDLEIESLENIFKTAQKDFSEWANLDDRKIADFIAKLPKKFEKLTDALIVARTRKLIEGEFGEMNFPKKENPINEFITPENIGDLKSFDDILSAISVNLTAYRPADYIKDIQPKSVLEDEKQRQKFLVKMMYILLIKRLESSWFSFKSTVENILNHHINALNKINQYIQSKTDSVIEDDLTEEEQEEIDETAAEINSETEEPITLGKKQPIPLSAITQIDLFKRHLEADIKKLSKLKTSLDKYEADFNAKKAQDEKLNKLIEHITNKQKKSDNKKVLVFTVFKDTAKFLYDELKKRGIPNVAFVSGSISETFDGYSGDKFEPILERFAPFTKLYNEKDWSDLYEKINLSDDYREADKWKVPYKKWLEIIKQHDKDTQYKIDNPIDVLIATDCLSEGQNLQDCDTVVNYDIHWNPVRLIQRMGRIDRIGSPNKTIRGINFWPGKNYEDYLNLKSRVENRMALMTVVGTELDDKMTTTDESFADIAQICLDNGLLNRGDFIIQIASMPIYEKGMTNTLKITQV
ncbi:helicase-related protein [Schleiferia thermophila]|uniref:Type III restriction/modification enzyme restriction subunit n=1 Tax=Schleiferia thermophila TaxID=884107 RepID=A0A369A9U6_9FLAO|nr:helicase-related protein [Schleiferia thermophila]RCX04867.1 type III restriction/modification enzyme restriction subunit [Schleiferia thermophila]GCD79609.1 helicase [Schleiferia thermophila]